MMHRTGMAVRLLAGITIALLAACSSQTQVREKTSQELFEEGQAKYAKKEYAEAVEAFREAARRYRNADLDAKIQIALADAYFAQGEYPTAAEAYAEFLRLHPHHGRADWAQYQIGACHLRQFRGPDRSQGSARRGLEAFEGLVRSHPRSPLLGQAREGIDACRRQLAEHELYVGRFYERTGEHAAAAGRYEVVLREYGDLGYGEEALYRLGRSYTRMGEGEKAAQVWGQLRRDFPRSRFLSEIETPG